MTIFLKNIYDFKQNFDVINENKSQFGEVRTDFKLIHKMFKLIPNVYFTMPELKWLDPCCGNGYFMIALYFKLYNSLENTIPDNFSRHKHIINNMLFMVEFNIEHISTLQHIFGHNANIFHNNFLNFNKIKPDVIIGNPPYNVNGSIKCPTSKNNKLNDGYTIWSDFVKHSIHLLKDNGRLLMITPSIWMKHDYSFHYFITQFKLIIHTFNSSETNAIFHGKAQLPTCYFHLTKYPSNDNVIIYDDILKKYITFPIQKNLSIPLNNISTIKKLLPYVKTFGSLKVHKTNIPSGFRRKNNKNIISDTCSSITPYSNIKTCIKQNNKPQIIYNYTSKKCPYADKPKIVLAHKMYGYPYYDENGDYGISNRDIYVITDKTNVDFHKLKLFLSSDIIINLFNSTRYRMRYLEKYIFDMLPDITKIPDFPVIINNNTIKHFFNL